MRPNSIHSGSPKPLQIVRHHWFFFYLIWVGFPIIRRHLLPDTEEVLRLYGLVKKASYYFVSFAHCPIKHRGKWAEWQPVETHTHTRLILETQ